MDLLRLIEWIQWTDVIWVLSTAVEYLHVKALNHFVFIFLIHHISPAFTLFFLSLYTLLKIKITQTNYLIFIA